MRISGFIDPPAVKERRGAACSLRPARGFPKARRARRDGQAGATPPKQLPISHFFQTIVGRIAPENDERRRRHVRGNDYWFHCRNDPGVSVFVKSVPGISRRLDTMLDAGTLALFYNKEKS
jgi:predicted ribosome quality control (RQC) complex YloA/Tae2 family protein